MNQTVMLIAEPKQVNRILARLAEAECSIVSLTPIHCTAFLEPNDVMIVYQVEHDDESGDAAFAHLSWTEETLGELCKIY